jgi:NADPH-dependent ferric siderophore reductase
MADYVERYFTADVLRVTELNPIFRRVELGGPGLADYASTGIADEWFRFAFPAASRSSVPPPTMINGLAHFADPQPRQRFYTIRRFDPAGPRLTVDVLLHGAGVASDWAEDVRAGDRVMISSAGGRYGAAPDAEWELIIADPTGLPAAGRILEELPAGRRAIAVLETTGSETRLEIESAAELSLTWLDNPDLGRGVSRLAAATRGLRLPAGPGYVWMAGEQAASRDLRRYFRHELGWGAERYDIVGYWRPDEEGYQRRYAAVQDQVAEIYQRGMAAGQDTEQILDEVLAVLDTHRL